ncbi:Leucine rich repeat-containing protein [Lachnospiraceae bacterium NK3A20]|nr:Leucine rich repeat-containing protein [Lachnospiraceae bacterium NK3A20]
MAGFKYTIQDKNGATGIEITGYEGEIRALYLPEEIDGAPVRSIGKFAFDGRRDLGEVHLPGSLRTLGLFAFRNCISLRSMELYNTTEDYYDGVIRACTSLRDITVHCVLPDNYIIVRELLQDTDAALTFHLIREDSQDDSQKTGAFPNAGTGEAARPAGNRTGSGEDIPQTFRQMDENGNNEEQPPRIIELTFPEYVSETNEDTMARAIHISIEGAGMAYRECVSKRSIDFAGYDRLLERLTEYDADTAADICLGRLRYPVALDPSARIRYEEYLRAHAGQVLIKVTREKRTDVVRFLAERALIPEEDIADAVAFASREENTEICGILMDYRHTHFDRAQPSTLSLDW